MHKYIPLKRCPVNCGKKKKVKITMRSKALSGYFREPNKLGLRLTEVC